MKKGILPIVTIIFILAPLPGLAADELPLNSKLSLFFLVYLLGLLLTVLLLLAIAKRGKDTSDHNQPK